MTRSLQKLFAKPLLISQAAGAASNAGAFLIVSLSLERSEFVDFTVINLAVLIAWGAVRNCIHVPALIAIRSDPRAVVPVWLTSTSTLVACIGVGCTALVLDGRLQGTILAVTISTAAPVLVEGLRLRRMAQRQYGTVAIADSARLITTPLLTLLPLTDAVLSQVFINCTFVLSIIIVSWHLEICRETAPVRSYSNIIYAQMVEYSVSQLASVVPLLVVGALGQTGLIAAVRFAQTLFGPVNVASSAASTHLLAEGATNKHHKFDASLVHYGRKISRLTTGGCAVVAAVAILGASFSPVLPGGLTRLEMILGTVLVSSVALSGAWSGIHNQVARLLGYYRQVAAGRTAIAATSSLGYIVGYLLGGYNGSIVGGMLSLAISTPIAFWLPTVKRYRRILRQNDT